MRFCVLGAGSLGSAIGGLLASGGHDVTLVTRNDAHVAAIEHRGLRLVGDRGERVIELGATTSAAAAGGADVVIVLVKSFDTRHAVTEAFAWSSPETVWLSLQNGVGCEEIIADVVGAERVVAGRTFVGGNMLEPGVVEYGAEGRTTVIGELDGAHTERIGELQRAFAASEMTTDISTDITAMMWEKLLVNVSTGAWSALTRLPYGELSKHTGVEPMAIATVAEAIEVAHALGIAITTTDPAEPWRRAWEGLPFGFRASMLQSIERGARTEVDVMHGAVCAGGRRAGVATPINDTLVAAVHGLERSLER